PSRSTATITCDTAREATNASDPSGNGRPVVDECDDRHDRAGAGLRAAPGRHLWWLRAAAAARAGGLFGLSAEERRADPSAPRPHRRDAGPFRVQPAARHL